MENSYGIAYMEGYQAFLAGKWAEDNPYEKSTPEYQEWEAGLIQCDLDNVIQ
jgi:ribosome modulation factor